MRAPHATAKTAIFGPRNASQYDQLEAWVKRDTSLLGIHHIVAKSGNDGAAAAGKGYAFSIGDNKSRVNFEVRTVESLPLPRFSETMRFRALSPVCVTRPVEKNGGLSAEYLAPEHPDYKKRFFENLVTRYKAAHPEVNGEFSDRDDFHLNVTGKPKSRLVKIKADTPQETWVRGYLFDFEEEKFLVLSLLPPPEIFAEGIEKINETVSHFDDRREEKSRF